MHHHHAPFVPRPSRSPAEELGLDPKTYEMYRQYQSKMADFEALLKKKGLSMTKLRSFASRYLEKNPKLAAEVKQQIAQGLAACKAPSKPMQGLPKPPNVLQSGHWRRA